MIGLRLPPRRAGFFAAFLVFFAGFRVFAMA